MINYFDKPYIIKVCVYTFLIDLILEDGQVKTICTLPKYQQQGICRECENHSQWRCDSGWCINGTKKGDGIPDCPIDMSDEELGSKILDLGQLSSFF